MRPAELSAALGWQIFPLPTNDKWPPPSGVTGKTGATESVAVPAGHNCGIRMPKGVCALDVDNGYLTKKGDRVKAGMETMLKLRRELGVLPPTYRLSSRHALDSGQLLYRIPADVELCGEIPAEDWAPDGKHSDVEILQFHHRYAVGPGSTIDDRDGAREYTVIGPDGVTLPCMPRLDALPELPAAWVDALRADAPRRGRRSASTEATVWDQFPDADGPRRLTAEQAAAAYAMALEEYRHCPVDPGYNREAFKFLCTSLAYARALGKTDEAWMDEVEDDVLKHDYFADGTWRRIDRNDRRRIDEVPGACNIEWEIVEAPEIRARRTGGSVRIIDTHWSAGASHAEPRDVASTWLDATGFLLRHWRGTFYRWSKGQWKPFEDGEMNRILWHDLALATYPKGDDMKDFQPTQAKVREVRDALAALGHRQDHWGTDLVIAFENGVLDPRTGELTEHDPTHFNTHKIQADYVPGAPCPAWHAFLASALPDEDQRHRLQEMFGYLLSGSRNLHKIFGIWGPPRSGKSTAMRVLAEILGQRAIGAPSLASLTTGFGLGAIKDASVIQINEARFDRDNRRAVDVLLKVSGEDAVEVNEKYKPQYSATLPGRIVMVSNEMPNVREDSGALSKRFVHLEFGVSFYGREDHSLGDRLRAEIPGIVSWAMEGYARLQAQGGRFTTTTAASRMELSLALHSGNKEAWWAERVIVDGVTECPAATLYDDYQSWCADSDVEIGHVGTPEALGRFVTGKGVGGRLVRVDGKVSRVRTGIRLGVTDANRYAA